MVEEWTIRIQSKQLHNYRADKKYSKLDSNLDTRLAHNTLGKAKPKYSWQYFTISIFLVVKSFMWNLLITKSRDCRSDLVKGHASRPYSSTGKHLALINWRVISSEATRPIFAKCLRIYVLVYFHMLVFKRNERSWKTIDVSESTDHNFSTKRKWKSKKKKRRREKNRLPKRGNERSKKDLSVRTSRTMIRRKVMQKMSSAFNRKF